MWITYSKIANPLGKNNVKGSHLPSAGLVIKGGHLKRGVRIYQVGLNFRYDRLNIYK